MNDPYYPALEVPAEAGFVPYTAAPALEEFLEEHLGPRGKVTLSEKFRHDYPRITPWVMAFFLPLQFVGVLLLVGISSLAFLLGHPSFISTLITVGLFVLNAMALPGMFKRSRRGWELMVYALVIGTFAQALHLSLIGTVLHIGFLFLAFQAKYQYR